MADIQEAPLYDRDFYRWALDQARAVQALRDAAQRSGSNFPAELQALDCDNLIEELDGLAKGVRSELRKRIATIVEHLAKLELSPVREPHAGWRASVKRSRDDIAELLSDNPSLRREIPGILAVPSVAKSAKIATEELIDRGEISVGTTPPTYSGAEILEDWWPDQKGTDA